MKDLRKKLERGLLLAALAGLLAAPVGCVGSDPVAYVPGDSADNSDDPGANDVRGDLDVYLEQPASERDQDRSAGQTEGH